MTRKGRSAIEEAQRTLDTNLRLMGNEHPETSTSMSTLAEAYRHSGDLVSPRTFDEEVLHIRRRLGGDENYFTLRAEHDLAMTLFDSTDYSMAMELQLHVLEWADSRGHRNFLVSRQRFVALTEEVANGRVLEP
jgi:hypothetical protein